MSVVSLRPHAVEAPLPTAVVGENPFSVAVSPDSQRLYVSGQEYINNRSEGFLTVVTTGIQSDSNQNSDWRRRGVRGCRVT